MKPLPSFCPIPYGRQHITQTDVAAVVQVLGEDYLTQGPGIQAFEEAFATYIGSQYAVAVSSGTAALHLCAIALGVREGDKVITSPLTFAASANCIKYCGGDIVLADIDPASGLLDLLQVQKLLESSPPGTYAGLIPVDFMGLAVQMDAFRQLAEEHHLWIIEDSCHAPGAYFDTVDGLRQRAGDGQCADLAIFSFHPVKHIATGEGGMITTNRADLYQRLLQLRHHGITKDPQLLTEQHGGWYYEMQELGYNYRLSNLHAALGISQLARADEGLSRRREIAKMYIQAFAGTSVRPLPATFVPGHAYHLFVVQVPDRKRMYDSLRQAGIYCQIHYIPLHYHPYYQQFGHKVGDHPHAENYYNHCLSLPMYPSLTAEQQSYVIEQILHLI
ncbi:MAG: UDP-4-amino-4,6-dideoxy-N-acetyl-beta-L-altrosamine transaminase [Bacteroidota bacterium]